MFKRIGLAVLLCAAAGGSQAALLNFSFSGTFSQDDDVQLFNFTADGASTAYLVSYAYGGGTQADGTVWSQGGFDTILALFDATGNLVTQNDDGSGSCFSGAEALVPGIDAGNSDTNTGALYDTCLSSVLAAGMYTVAVSQYDNFPNGPTLSDGFVRDGQGNFTASFTDCTQGSFCDVTGTPVFTNRTNAWAFDILNVEQASQDMPVPGSLALAGIGLLALRLRRRRR
jgi:uncharacterized protein (TIGR03382 family)